MKICLVEDNRDLGEAIERHLRRDGHAVTWVTEGEGVDDLIAIEGFDAMILDLTLPGADGVTILRRLRRSGNDLPVLVTTARAELDDKVSLLDLGADDYLVKPFDLRELDARLRAVLRRPTGHPSSRIVLGNLVLDQAAHAVTVSGTAVDLGLREFRLLELLVTSAGRVVTRERLMSRLFDIADGGSENALELLVSRLRRKIAEAAVEIVTVRGVGYLARTSQDADL
jgi:two-component system response regulator TctD